MTDIVLPHYETGVQDTFVSIEDLDKVLNAGCHNTKNAGEVNYSIQPVTNDSADTLMYIINYGNNNGWQIISADERTPAILAEGETGYFSLAEGAPGLGLWLSDLSKTMEVIRHSDNSSLLLSEESINANLSFWGKNSTRQIVPPQNPKDGQWYESIRSEIIIDTVVNHIVAHWDQDAPYNMYCPYKSNQNVRTSVGCVAVAGSQMLYFLHEQFGVPLTIPSSGFCIGDKNGFSREFYNFSEDAWDDIMFEYSTSVESTNTVALLLGYVGSTIGMHYANEYSWALPNNLKNDLFEPYGYSCTYERYSEAQVRTSLLSGMPVIVVATNWLVPIDFNIHCFVIDGYKETHTQYTHYHYWVPDDPEAFVAPGEHDSYITYSESPRTLTEIKINWGWRSQWGDPSVNDGWYTLTGDWETSMGSWNYNRYMLHDFSL